MLDAQGETRVQELLPIRYERMAASPFAFYRGAAAVMAMDLASAPVTGMQVQACGDAHVANFGKFATPERSLVFDINDFDETVPGPWEWDVKRLAGSLHVVAHDRRFAREPRDEIVEAAVRAYREHMADAAAALDRRPLVRPDAHQGSDRTLPAEVPAGGGARREESAPQGPPARDREVDHE